MTTIFRIQPPGLLDGATVPVITRAVRDPLTGIYDVPVTGSVGLLNVQELMAIALGNTADDHLVAQIILTDGAATTALELSQLAYNLPTAGPESGIARRLLWEYVSATATDVIGPKPFLNYTGQRLVLESDNAVPGEAEIYVVVVPVSGGRMIDALCCTQGDDAVIPPAPPAAPGLTFDYSVNAAAVDVLADGSNNLRTGARVNLAGGFTGGGTGNKSIRGVLGFSGTPLGNLTDLAYVWENVVGPGGPFFNPPGGPAVQTPYANVLVDFDPNGVGDIRVLVMLDDSLNALITAAIGTYTNPGGLNTLTYAWDSTMDVLIVLAPPNLVPGGVLPNVSVGALWLENSYSFAALVAANPDAILLDVYPADGGLPAGAVMPSVLVASGDSGNVTRSGKRLTSLTVNGASQL